MGNVQHGKAFDPATGGKVIWLRKKKSPKILNKLQILEEVTFKPIQNVTQRLKLLWLPVTPKQVIKTDVALHIKRFPTPALMVHYWESQHKVCNTWTKQYIFRQLSRKLCDWSTLCMNKIIIGFILCIFEVYVCHVYVMCMPCTKYMYVTTQLRASRQLRDCLLCYSGSDFIYTSEKHIFFQIFPLLILHTITNAQMITPLSMFPFC